jgi:hypothetical protein
MSASENNAAAHLWQGWALAARPLRLARQKGQWFAGRVRDGYGGRSWKATLSVEGWKLSNRLLDDMWLHHQQARHVK